MVAVFNAWGMLFARKNSLIHSIDNLMFLKSVYANVTLTIYGEVTDIQNGLGLIIVNSEIKRVNLLQKQQ